MTYDEIDPAIRHCIGLQSAFRRLGFLSDDIFVGAFRDTAWVVLKTQEKEFMVGAAKTEHSIDKFAELWVTTASEVVSGKVTAEVCERCWQECLAYNDSFNFVAAIVGKGIILPCADPVVRLRQKSAQN